MSNQLNILDYTCKNCGFPRSQHITVSYAGGVLINTPYICPTAVFHKVEDKLFESRTAAGSLD